MHFRRLPPRGPVFVAATLIAALLNVGTSHAAGREIVYSRQVAPGVIFQKVYDPSGPFRIFVLKVDLTKRVTFDVGLASRSVGGFEQTSSIAGRYGAIAAVNGDFANWSGRPMHPFAEDGALRYTSSSQFGANFAVSRDERSRFLGMPKIVVDVRDVRTKRGFEVGRWNDDGPYSNGVAAFAPGGTTDQGPDNSCSARLKPAARATWGPNKSSVSRLYRVGRRTCSPNPLPLAGGTVLSSRMSGTGAQEIQGLRRGDRVTLSWSFGWKDVVDSVGGLPILLRRGRIQQRCNRGDFCGRNPRTAVGVTADGHLLLVAVDGRQWGWSVGMGLLELSQLLKWLGATDAMNLDGGGSTTMVVRGKVVNRPSDWSGERAISSALLLLPGRDKGEAGFKGGLVPPVAVAADAAGGPRYRPGSFPGARDPGSTGGVLDAMARGAFGPPVHLAGSERATLNSFRARSS